jgi:alkylation response protein AidB-like acyl-CoA dehydrogenase
MQTVSSISLDPAMLAGLAEAAASADDCADWPAASWQRLCAAGVLAWSIPKQHGGAGLSGVDLLWGYEQIASACLTTAFVLSQREGAVRRLLASTNSSLTARWLPRLARGEAFATVGLSQLTTSRQHLAPSLRAQQHGDLFELDGVIPWVTGADHADVIVVGATLADNRQILLALPRLHPGVAVEAPAPLMALAGSRTSQIRLDGVRLGADCLIAGPAEKIMAGRPGGVGGLETSSLALGHAGAAITWLHDEAQHRPDLAGAAERFEAARRQTRTCLHELAQGSPTPEAIVALRVDCTLLALRAAETAMTVAKGTGFVKPHPAQRWARQALFFLVWSCPRPAAEGLIQRLLPEG